MAAAPADSLSVFFLSQEEQTAASVMARLTTFIAGANEILEFALYDLRLSEVLKQQLAAALHARAAAGVQIRICYDGDKPFVPTLPTGQDPAPRGAR